MDQFGESFEKNSETNTRLEEEKVTCNLAKRIHHQKVLFPAPNHLLMEGMAVAGYAAFAKCIDIEIEGRIKDWDDSSDFIKDAWIETARAMYVMLAVAAGAEVTDIPEKPKG